MNRTLLRWHLGLGDALICNGLVRVLVERGLALTLPSKPHNEPSVRAMFSDLGDAVEVLPVLDDDYINPHSDELRLGYFGDNFDPRRWDESFYHQAGVPFLAKWQKFKLPNEVYDIQRNEGRVFIHDDAERGFVINMEGYRPLKKGTIFEHLPVLECGCTEEIHCINSCFAILADLIKAPGKKYLHYYARPTDLPIFGEHWTVLQNPL